MPSLIPMFLMHGLPELHVLPSWLQPQAQGKVSVQFKQSNSSDWSEHCGNPSHFSLNVKSCVKHITESYNINKKLIRDRDLDLSRPSIGFETKGHRAIFPRPK